MSGQYLRFVAQLDAMLLPWHNFCNVIFDMCGGF